MKKLLVLTLLLAGLSSCASLRGNYFGNRVADVLEVPQFRIGYGGPFNIHGKATDYFSASLGVSNAKNFLLFGKGSHWAEEHHSGLGPNQATSPLWKDDGEFDYRFFGWHHSARNVIDEPENTEWEHASVMFVELPTSKKLLADKGDVSLGLAFGINLELGLSLGQGLDALLGIFGADFGQDDITGPQDQPATPPAE